MAPTFVHAEKQHFECRDCPARCCRVPWQIQFGKEERDRYLADEWVRERAGPEGIKILEQRTLPFVERDRRLQCAFLDDDQLCGLQKKYGHAYLPGPCQVFPYGFVRSDKGDVVVSLSRLCPSVQRNSGQPIEGQLKSKLKQIGKPETLAERLGTLNGVTLRPRHYLGVVRHWEHVLETADSPAQALVDLFDWTNAFEDALPTRSDDIKDVSVDDAMARASQVEPLELHGTKSTPFQARNLFGYQLGNLCYPSRIRVAHRAGQKPPFTSLRSGLNKLAFLLEFGTVDMLFIEKPVKLHRVKRVERVLSGPLRHQVGEHLLRVLRRRHLMTERRYIMSILVDLAIGTVLATRFARCRASSEGREQVDATDVTEGLGVADFFVLSHLVEKQQGTLMLNLRKLLLSRRADFRKLLASEL